jgi:hypothetical protein
MKLVRLCVVTLTFIVFGTVLSYADKVDPRIGVGEPACQETDQIVTSNTFTVSTDNNGGGQFFFCNQSGQNWQNMYFFAQTSISPSDVVCDPGAFVMCQAFTSNLAPGYLYIEFAGVVGIPAPPLCPNGCPGVPNNEQFFVNFNCGDFEGCSPWPANLPFSVVANSNGLPLPVPEPASAALIGTSIVSGCAIKFRRRRFARRTLLS